MSELPIGWREVKPTGRPGDDGTPEEERESTARPKDAKTELCRWVRGTRYVRVCYLEKPHGEYSHSLCYGRLDRDGDDTALWLDGDEAELYACNLMRIGGVPR